MFVEIRNEHPMYKDFIGYVQSKDPDAEIRVYEISTYINTKVRIINFFSCISHDITTEDRDSNGRLISFPLDLFGTIYEMQEVSK